MHSQESQSGGRHPCLIKQIMVAFSVWFTLTGVAVAEQYLCIAEHSAGFSYDKVTKEWKNSTFKVSSKYLISKADGTKNAWHITEIGETFPLFRCESDFDEYGYLDCSDSVNSKFYFNKNNGRYLASYPLGYYIVLPGLNKFTDETSDTPNLEIGKCSPF